ncbi:MAG: preprotein translocase subunit SecG [Candidatus Aureabacteria bacterium]|nr:preprotein translocase subunit SecG [Candidatus Auribacterota bacterium]
MWFTVVAVLHVLICIFLVAIVLMQSAKGHGLAGAFGSFGGGMAQNLFGAQAGDMLTKITTFTAAAFVASSLTLAVLSAKKSSSIMTESSGKAVTEKTVEETPAKAPVAETPAE